MHTIQHPTIINAEAVKDKAAGPITEEPKKEPTAVDKVVDRLKYLEFQCPTINLDCLAYDLSRLERIVAVVRRAVQSGLIKQENFDECFKVCEIETQRPRHRHSLDAGIKAGITKYLFSQIRIEQ